MKLAEALNERADLQKRIEQLRKRLENNAKVQEGEKPDEEPEELLTELDRVMSRLEELMIRINITNSKTASNAETLTAKLAKRDMLALKIKVLRNFLEQANYSIVRETRSEVKIKSTVCVSEMQKKVDLLSKELRELDISIQEINWTTELV